MKHPCQIIFEISDLDPLTANLLGGKLAGLYKSVCGGLSFPLSMDDANCVKLVAMEIADIFSGQYQVYYGVHEDEAHLHIHYAINTVSYVDGKKWHKSRKEIERLEAQMRERAGEVLWR